MSFGTKIAYCHATFNPWMGCSKVSPGCENCFAERWAKRTGMVEWGPGKPRRRTSESYWKQPLKWNNQAQKEGTHYRVLADLCDVFDQEVQDQDRGSFLCLVNDTPNLDWLILTKRIQMAKDYYDRWKSISANIWLGITVCNQEESDRDIPILLRIPAAMRWLSIEPMLGPVVIKDLTFGAIQWIVCGCESGPKARPMNSNWVRDLRDQCAKALIPFYLKQMMVNGKLVIKPELDGQKWEQIPE